jgi:hypothetical protein
VRKKRKSEVSNNEYGREHRMAGWIYGKLFNDFAPTTEIIYVKLCEGVFRFIKFKII